MKPTTCPFCLSDEMFGQRWDKKGRPFFSCGMCRHKLFIQTGLAYANIILWLRGIAHVAHQVRDQAPEILRQMYGTAAPDLAHAAPKRGHFHQIEVRSAEAGAA